MKGRAIINVFVPGVPVPQGSRASFLHKSTGKVVSPERERVKSWRGTVATFASAAPHVFFDDGPLGLKLVFVLTRPKAARRGMTPHALAAKRPDLDKLIRAVFDALTGIWFADDSLVCAVEAEKIVASPGAGPGVSIEMWSI